MIHYVVVKQAPPKNLDFFVEIYIKSITLKVEGPNQDIFIDLPFNSCLRPIHSNFVKYAQWSHAQP